MPKNTILEAESCAALSQLLNFMTMGEDVNDDRNTLSSAGNILMIKVFCDATT